MSESFGLPAYQQVADDLRRRIAAGEYPVGSPIPSTTKLTKDYGVSVTVVRAAVAQLRTAGVLAGQPGKGVFVRATPEAAAERAATLEDLSRQLEELRADLRQADAARREELTTELSKLRGSLDLIRARLADLYAQLGKTYPEDGPPPIPSAQRPAGGARD